MKIPGCLFGFFPRYLKTPFEAFFFTGAIDRLYLHRPVKNKIITYYK